jgi:hypothetical protein
MSDEATHVGPLPGAEGGTPPGQPEAAALDLHPPDGSADPDLARIARYSRVVLFEVGRALNQLNFSLPQAWCFPSAHGAAREDALEVVRRANLLRPRHGERRALQAEVVGRAEDLLAIAAQEDQNDLFCDFKDELCALHAEEVGRFENLLAIAGQEDQNDLFCDFEDDLKNPLWNEFDPPDDPDCDPARNELCDDYFCEVREAIDRIRRAVCAGLDDRDRALVGLGELVDQGLRRPDAYRFLCLVDWLDDESGASDGSGRGGTRPPVTCPPAAQRPGGVPPRFDWADQIVRHAHDLGILALLPGALLRRPGPDEETEAGRVARVEGLAAAVRLALEDRPDPVGEETGPGAAAAGDEGSVGTTWRPLNYLDMEVDRSSRRIRRPGFDDLRFDGNLIWFHIFLILAKQQGEWCSDEALKGAWKSSGRARPSPQVLKDAVSELRRLLVRHRFGLEIPRGKWGLGYQLIERSQDSPPRP